MESYTFSCWKCLQDPGELFYYTHRHTQDRITIKFNKDVLYIILLFLNSMTLCCPNHTFDSIADLDELSFMYLTGCSNRICVFISHLALYMMRTLFILITQPFIFLLSLNI